MWPYQKNKTKQKTQFIPTPGRPPWGWLGGLASFYPVGREGVGHLAVDFSSSQG